MTRRVVMALFLCASGLMATAQRPAFEVATIKQNRTGAENANVRAEPGGRVSVTNNTVRRVLHSGIRLENSTRNNVTGNQLTSTGTGGIPSFDVINTTDSQILNNVVSVAVSSPIGSSIIQESGTSRNNVYKGNTNGNTTLNPIISH